MLDRAIHQPGPDAAEDSPAELIAGAPGARYLILCDHASAHIPAEYCDLGLPRSELSRHIGYDIGARGVAIALARAIGAPAVLNRTSRLLIDPNRGADDPTLVMRIADGAVVPGNASAGEDEIARRIARFHKPYHDAIDAVIDRAIEAGIPPAIVSIHSFTPRFKGIDRPWHATVLWDCDPRLPIPLARALEREAGIVSGENVPYSGRLAGDTMFRHGTERGLAHALLELRQDLIAQEAGQNAWAARLARILRALAATPGLNEIQDHRAHIRR